jgi:hypothetical protein
VKLTGREISRIMDQLRAGFDAGHLKPSPTTTWPLSGALEAYRAVERGGTSTEQVLLLQQS